MTLVAISSIVIPLRHRAYRDVTALAESISRVGLLQPIILTEGRTLIAGLHRLEACKSLGHREIKAEIRSFSDVDAELAEIDENLIRNELSALERAEHLARRKAIYEAIHPETRATAEGGGFKGNQHVVPATVAVTSFATDTARATGLSERTVFQDIQIAVAIPAPIRDAIRDTPLADKKRELIELARVPEAEQMAVVEKIASGESATVADAVHNHRAQGTGENEWYTPPEHIAAARAVLGTIDLDPASSEIANRTVKAERFFSIADDGLKQEWAGKRIYMNPPYAQPFIMQFVAKLVQEIAGGNVTEAIALTHNYTDTAWFHLAMSRASAVCFTKGRIGFLSPEGKRAAPTQGQAFIYFGDNVKGFADVFARFGFVVVPSGI